MDAINDFLNKILGFLGRQNSSSVLGLDISSSSIKVVQLKKKLGRVTLETYGELALGPYGQTDVGRSTNLPAETIAEAVKALLKEAKTTTMDCGVSIPSSSSLISFIELPETAAKDLERIIPIEARRYIPVPISEVSLDWLVVPGGPEAGKEPKGEGKPAGKVEILLFAIHNETIAKFRAIVSQVGLSSTFFEIEIFSTIRAVLDRGIAPTMIMDFGASATKLYIVEHGVVKNSHIINRGGQDITIALSSALSSDINKAEELKRAYGLKGTPSDPKVAESVSLSVGSILAEANQTVVAYQARENKSVGKVVLTGGGALMPGVEELAREIFKTEVELADPFAKVQTPAFLESVLKKAGPEFAVAIGVALRKLEEKV